MRRGLNGGVTSSTTSERLESGNLQLGNIEDDSIDISIWSGLEVGSICSFKSRDVLENPRHVGLLFCWKLMILLHFLVYGIEHFLETPQNLMVGLMEIHLSTVRST